MAVQHSSAHFFTSQVRKRIQSMGASTSPSRSNGSNSSSSRGTNSTTNTTPELSNAPTTASKQGDFAGENEIDTVVHSNPTDHTKDHPSPLITPVTYIDPPRSPAQSPAASQRDIEATNTIRTLTKSDIDKAAYTLAQAFEHDEMSQYFTHTPDRQYDDSKLWDVHFFIMKCIVRAHIQSGLATTIGDNYDCVALWWGILTRSYSFLIAAYVDKKDTIDMII